MTHPLLDQLARQRRDELAARVRAQHPTWAEATGPEPSRRSSRRGAPLSRLVALVSRA